MATSFRPIFPASSPMSGNRCTSKHSDNIGNGIVNTETTPTTTSSPPQPPRKSPLRPAARGLGYLLAIGGVPSAFNLWLTASARIYLFVFESHFRLGMNHSDDYGYVYSNAWWLLPMGLFSTILLWQPLNKWKNLALWVFAANLLAMITFVVMHWTGILVSYDEYIRSGS